MDFSQKEVDELKKEISLLKSKNEENNKTLEELDGKTKKLEERANYQEDASRRDNLRIDGIVEEEGETWGQTAESVVNFLKNELDMPYVDLNAIHRAHRTGKRGSQPRTIVARMARFCDRDQALRSAPKHLKGTKIRISEDLCKASQEKRSAQWSRYIDAKKNNKIAFFNYTKLIVRDRPDASTLADEEREDLNVEDGHPASASRNPLPPGSQGRGRGAHQTGNQEDDGSVWNDRVSTRQQERASRGNGHDSRRK